MHYDPIMCMVVEDKVKTKDANTLYETFAHGKSKHAGILEMNGKVKVVVWNEGDNPRTGKVTVVGEDTPDNRIKAKAMLDSMKIIDKAIRNCDYAYGTAEIKDVNGKWVVFRGGKYVQGFDNSDDAEAFVREKGWH